MGTKGRVVDGSFPLKLGIVPLDGYTSGVWRLDSQQDSFIDQTPKEIFERVLLHLGISMVNMRGGVLDTFRAETTPPVSVRPRMDAIGPISIINTQVKTR